MTSPQTVPAPTRPPRQLSMPLDSVRLRGMDPSQRATVVARLASLLMEAAGTLSGARRIIAWYAQLQRLDPRRLGGARNALYALSRVHQVMGLNPPAWQIPESPRPPGTELLREYADHLGRHSGNPETTVHKKLVHIGKLSEHLAEAGKAWDTMVLTDIDAFLIGCAERYARSTVADIAGSVRCFARFLLATGRISIDLAEAVISPIQPKLERPRRALPWTDVQRLLRSVDVSSPGGLHSRFDLGVRKMLAGGRSSPAG